MIKRHLVLQQPGFLSVKSSVSSVLKVTSLSQLCCGVLIRPVLAGTFSPFHLMYTLKGALNFMRARNEGHSSSLGRAAGVESRRRAGEGAAGRWVGATRRRRRPPNFTTSEPASWRECRQGPGAGAQPRGPGHGAARPSPAVPPDPLPSAGTGPEAPPPPGTPPPRCPGTLAPGPRGLLLAPPPDPARTGPAGKAAAARGRPGPAAGRRRARRSLSFPPFLLAQTRLGRTGPLVLCLLLLLHGAMRLGGGSREKLARGRAGRAARTGRGEGGRLAEEEAAGRRRRPGRTRGIPRAAGGLSRAGTRVLRYPSSHRRQ
nr:atherin-like [Chlorocebus sabaeus]